LLIGNTNREYTTIYITLPLATSTVDPTGQIGGRLSSDYHSKPIAAAV
jgi:hypothetical protein